MMLEYTIRLGKELEIVGRRFFDPPVIANSDMAKSIASLTSDHGRRIFLSPDRGRCDIRHRKINGRSG